MGECGLRGGYAEIINLDPKVKDMYLKSISAKLCPTTLGQVSFYVNNMCNCLCDVQSSGWETLVAVFSISLHMVKSTQAIYHHYFSAALNAL